MMRSKEHRSGKRIVVVGLGSMGLRRIKLLFHYDPSFEIIGVDPEEDKRRTANKIFGINTKKSFDDVIYLAGIIAIFISSPPLTHYELMERAVRNGINVFSELNLRAYCPHNIIKVAQERDIVVFLSSTMLYRKEVQYIIETVARHHYEVGYRYHVGQYLPDWHPWERYQDFFVGNKKTDACREIMAIEFPWIMAAFGGVNNIQVKRSKISKLEVDYPDKYSLLLEHDTGVVGTIDIDIISRKCIRSLELIGENIYLTWNGTPDTLVEYDYNKNIDRLITLYTPTRRRESRNATIIEDAYYEEIVDFFRAIKKKGRPRYSLEKDIPILRIIDFIEGERDSLT